MTRPTAHGDAALVDDAMALELHAGNGRGDGGVLGGVGGADANDPGAASEGAGCGHRGGGYLRRRLCLKTSIFSRLFWAERRVFGQEPEFLGKVRLWGQVPDLLGKNAEFRDFGSKSANLSRVTTT